MIVGAALGVGLGLGLAGCERKAGWSEREVDPGLVALDTGRMHLRHDRVGHDRWASEASFVLVDAENTHDEDLLVTLDGALVDAEGRELGALRPVSLRIPAGGVRTFALIDREQQVRARAARAEVRVTGAYVPGHAPPVVVTEGHVYRDGDRVVATARVRNTADRPVRVIVLGGFHDARGVPLTRPFSELYLPGDASHPVQFVGPPGSVKGYVFIGDAVY